MQFDVLDQAHIGYACTCQGLARRQLGAAHGKLRCSPHRRTGHPCGLGVEVEARCRCLADQQHQSCAVGLRRNGERTQGKRIGLMRGERV